MVIDIFRARNLQGVWKGVVGDGVVVIDVLAGSLMAVDGSIADVVVVLPRSSNRGVGTTSECGAVSAFGASSALSEYWYSNSCRQAVVESSQDPEE